MLINIPQCTGIVPTMKNNPAQNISWAEDEKSRCKIKAGSELATLD